MEYSEHEKLELIKDKSQEYEKIAA